MVAQATAGKCPLERKHAGQAGRCKPCSCGGNLEVHILGEQGANARAPRWKQIGSGLQEEP